jgi:hypothetical protein
LWWPLEMVVGYTCARMLETDVSSPHSGPVGLLSLATDHVSKFRDDTGSREQRLIKNLSITINSSQGSMLQPSFSFGADILNKTSTFLLHATPSTSHSLRLAICLCPR